MVLLGYAADFFHGAVCRACGPPGQACRRQLPNVSGFYIALQRVGNESDHVPPRKLLAVDYFGAVLTLAGCTLVLLPLIWVRP